MEKKLCSRCNTPKFVDRFHFKNRAQNLRHSHCATCEAEDKKGYYYSGHRRERQGRFNKRRRFETRQKAFDYLASHPCVDCPENDPIVLQFDHIDIENKTLSISEMLSQNWSWDRIAVEIEKCVVRCANCHQRRTAKQFNWFKQVLKEAPHKSLRQSAK